MLSCTITLDCNVAKRLMHDAGICAQLHGYRLSIEVTVAPKKARNKKQESDMVIDFYVLKQSLQAWLNAHWEHTVILNKNDRALGSAISKITKQKIFYTPEEPTAEWLALYLLRDIVPSVLPNDVRCTQVRVADTADAWTTATA